MNEDDAKGREEARKAQIAKQSAIACAVQYQQIIVMKKYRKELMDDLVRKCRGSKKQARERIKQYSKKKVRQQANKKALLQWTVPKKRKQRDNDDDCSSSSEEDDSSLDSEATLIEDIIGVKKNIFIIEKK